MKQYMKSCPLVKATISRNEYGEVIKAYSFDRNVMIAIFFQSEAERIQNEVLFEEYTHIGLTRDAGIEKGNRIDGKEVIYVLPTKPFNRIFLKELI